VKISHLGFVVRDIDFAKRLWLSKGYKENIPVVFDPNQNVYCCLLQLDEEIPIELISPGPGSQSPVDSRLSRGGGIDHICYEVSDLEDQIAHLTSRGYRIIVPPIHAVMFRQRISFLMSPGGLLVEYLEVKSE